jgi:hypothetical protein
MNDLPNEAIARKPDEGRFWLTEFERIYKVAENTTALRYEPTSFAAPLCGPASTEIKEPWLDLAAPKSLLLR